MRITAFTAVLFALVSVAVGGEPNCFAPFLSDKSPKIVETLSRETKDGVETTRLKFLSRVEPKSGREVIIYAVMSRPTTPGPHPGVLVCHGGGGYADMVASATVGWARRGFVSVCQDQPGICNRAKAHSSGPCMDPGANSFTIVDSPADSALFDGIAAALGGLSLLRSQPDVDKSRVGVVGGSWGGYTTTMVAGLAGDRVRAAFSIYGCGYFDIGSSWTHRLDSMQPKQRKIWLDNLDAGRRASNLSAAYFVPSPANDWYFWPVAVMRTLADMPGEKNYCFMPNDSHSLRQPGGMSGPPRVDHRYNRTFMEIVWLEYHLTGKGKPFPTCKAVGKPLREGNSVRVDFQVKGPEPITRATVWYAAGELPWRMKWWSPAAAEISSGGEGRYTALLPVDEPGEPLDWFAVVTDERNVSVSTLVRAVTPKTLGFKLDGYPANRFKQDFEDPLAGLRWRRRYADRGPGRSAVCEQAAHSGKRGLQIKGKLTCACRGVRGVDIKRSGADKLQLWIRAAERPCPMPVIEFEAELPDSRRFQWRWTPDASDLVGPEWRLLEIPLAQFKYVGPDAPPVDMLSSALGHLRLISTKETFVHVDDVEAR